MDEVEIRKVKASVLKAIEFYTEATGASEQIGVYSTILTEEEASQVLEGLCTLLTGLLEYIDEIGGPSDILQKIGLAFYGDVNE